MNKSESIKELSMALAKFQGKVKDPRKDGDNPFFKSKYVELDALLACARPVLSECGLSIMQFPSNEDSQAVSVTTLLMHSSGEFIEADPLIMKPENSTPHGIGSCITYARRYSLSSILGLAWEKDDDGNAASSQPNCKNKPKEQPKLDMKNKYLHDTMNIAKGANITPDQVLVVITWKFGDGKTSKDLTESQAKDLSINVVKWWNELTEADNKATEEKK